MREDSPTGVTNWTPHLMQRGVPDPQRSGRDSEACFVSRSEPMQSYPKVKSWPSMHWDSGPTSYHAERKKTWSHIKTLFSISIYWQDDIASKGNLDDRALPCPLYRSTEIRNGLTPLDEKWKKGPCSPDPEMLYNDINGFTTRQLKIWEEKAKRLARRKKR